LDEIEEETKIDEIRNNKINSSANKKKMVQISNFPLKKNNLRNILDENLFLHDRI
jgi:hypothetical protein